MEGCFGHEWSDIAITRLQKWCQFQLKGCLTSVAECSFIVMFAITSEKNCTTIHCAKTAENTHFIPSYIIWMKASLDVSFWHLLAWTCWFEMSQTKTLNARSVSRPSSSPENSSAETKEEGDGARKNVHLQTWMPLLFGLPTKNFNHGLSKKHRA